MTMASYPVPSRRYDQFIKVFERKVEAAQTAIRAVEAMEQPYNLITEALEEAKLPNDCELSLHPGLIKIEMQAVPSDFLTTFDPLIAGIGTRLLEAKMHKDGIPARSDGGFWYHFRRLWTAGGGARNLSFVVVLEVNVPLEGLRDLEVVRVERPSIDYEYKFKPRVPAKAGGAL